MTWCSQQAACSFHGRTHFLLKMNFFCQEENIIAIAPENTDGAGHNVPDRERSVEPDRWQKTFLS